MEELVRRVPWKTFMFGFVLVLLGAVLPFLMVLEVIKASFLLSFLAYGASVAGLFIGLIGAASYGFDVHI